MTDDNEREGVPTDVSLERETTHDDPDARVDRLASEIDDTRSDLTQTISAIGEKLDPGNIAREAGDTVRAATLGKVEQMSYGAQETWRDVRTGNTGSIVDTITSNPVPAGMVALGLGMLFMNRGAKGAPARGDWQRQRWDQPVRGDSALDRVGSTVGDVGDSVKGKVGDVGDTVKGAADSAGRKLTGVMEGVGDAASDIPQQAGHMVEERAGQVRRFIDENPLGAGVIALAAGAAIGLLLPSTPLERETLGQARNELVSKAESGVHDALDKVEEQVAQA